MTLDLNKIRVILQNASSKELRGHRNRVHSVAWNMDGTKLASGSTDHTARVFSLDSKQGISRDSTELKGHSSEVEQMCWDPTHPEKVVTASLDKSIRLWDVRAPRIPAKIIPTPGENINLCWSPDGKRLAVGNKQDTVTIIDPRGGNNQVNGSTESSQDCILHTFKSDFEVNEMSWGFTGNLLYLTTGQGTVHIMDSSSYTTLLTLPAHTPNIYAIDMDPKGRYFATGGADALVCLWDLEDLSCLQTYGRLDWPVRSLAFSFDGELMAIGSEDQFIDIAHVESGEQVRSIKTHGATNTLSWHPTKHLLAYAGDEYDRSQRPEGNLRVFGFT